MPRIALIEDSPEVTTLVRDELRQMAYEVRTAGDGEQGLALCLGWRPDLVLLDVMLPGCDGFTVLHRLRQRGDTTPVLILSARSADQDRIRGLELEADDYLTKPFNLRELLLRVDALLRRSRAPSPGADTLSFGGNTIDFRAMRAKTWTGEDAELTATEVRLVKLLWAHSGTVVSRKIVVEHLFGSTAPLTVRTLDNVVLRLRKLFERNPGEPAHLHTVRGLGFRFEP